MQDARNITHRHLSTPETVTRVEQRIVAIELDIPRHAMQTEMPHAIHELVNMLMAQGVPPTGPLITHHYRMDPSRFVFQVGFPVEADVESTGRVRMGTVPGGQVVSTVLTGGYDLLPDAWLAFSQWMKARSQALDGEFLEIYLVGPDSEADPDHWQTQLCQYLIP